MTDGLHNTYIRRLGTSYVVALVLCLEMHLRVEEVEHMQHVIRVKLPRRFVQRLYLFP